MAFVKLAYLDPKILMFKIAQSVSWNIIFGKAIFRNSSYLGATGSNGEMMCNSLQCGSEVAASTQPPAQVDDEKFSWNMYIYIHVHVHVSWNMLSILAIYLDVII